MRSNGEAAYIAGDIAYYLNKRERGFDRCLIMLGADHHGYIGRLMAWPPRSATPRREPRGADRADGQPREGRRPDADVEARGHRHHDGGPVEASAWTPRGTRSCAPASTPRSTSTSTSLAKHTNDNPVYYVQYAHARTRPWTGTRRPRASRASGRRDAFDPSLLTHPTETELLGTLEQFPRTVERAAELREPHRVARYLEQLAGDYHRWYDSCRIIPPAGEPTIGPCTAPAAWSTRRPARC